MPSSSRSGPPPIGPADPRYEAVVEKRFNKRFRATPDHVFLVHSTDEIVAAVQQTVREGRRLVVTSGGHCLEECVPPPALDCPGGLTGEADSIPGHRSLPRPGTNRPARLAHAR
jgi:hypothetical protein